MIVRDDLPETPDWQPTSRPCELAWIDHDGPDSWKVRSRPLDEAHIERGTN